MLSFIEASSKLLPKDQGEADARKSAIAKVMVPADPATIANLAFVLLAQYHAGTGSNALSAEVADVWLHHLGKHPAWAIERACLWWVGPENDAKSRRRKPLPGDIAERCDAEIHIIRIAETKLGFWDRYQGNYPQFLIQKEGDQNDRPSLPSSDRAPNRSNQAV